MTIANDNTPPEDENRDELDAGNLSQPGGTEAGRDDVDRALEIQGANARASWNFSADHVQQGLRHCTPERKEVLLWCFQWCLDRGIYFPEFATRVDYAPNTLYKIFTGRHVDPKSGQRYDITDKLYQACLGFRREEKLRHLQADADFVVTPTVKRIWQACDLARESHTPVFLYGASHVGKTWGLNHYSVENNHGRSPYVRIPAASGLGGMVDAIALRVGVSQKGNTKEKIDRIKNSLSPNQVLILDEVHELIYTYRRESFFACLEVVRDIYDHSGCGLVLVVTNVFRREMEGAKKAHLEQIFKRGVHRVQLGNIVRVADLRAIFDHHALKWPARKQSIDIGGVKDQPYEILRALAKDEGLKSITERIRYAKRLAVNAKERLSLKHFVHAHLIIERNAQLPEDDWE
ncbi:AAA family ATPase [Haloferula sargassicola]|uniref:ORC1/DEAH AAA+ ATPase domain-containing protein n=1 Tax=Haloferula sargassicola TaxID=490096 RepID=A0ABP9UKP1_9BACT